MRRLISASATLTILTLLICSFEAEAQPSIFTDVADSMGIAHTYNGSSFGGGVSFCDFDNDGLEDVSLASWDGERVNLYKNNGSTFSNIAPQTAIADTAQSKTLLWADLDNDGDKDLFVANGGASNRLYRNDEGVFVDVTQSSGMSTVPRLTIAACAGDYDNDGLLDLYVTNRASTSPNFLYHNEGNLTFTDMTSIAGVADSVKLPLAVSFLDYNNDGWQDIYIAIDRMGGNTLFKNLGNGTFEDVSVISNSNLAFDAMGIAIGDYDNDGDLDMYISNTESGNGLLRNNGDGTFSEIADSLGIAVNRICWGVNFLDYDNDSDLDLYVSVNHPSPQNPDITNVLFENLGDGSFQEATGTGFETDTSLSWGNAVGDFNNDGYCDIADLNSTPTQFKLWKNAGGANNWIKVKLEGTMSNRDAVGSIIELYMGGSRIIRSTHCGISYLSQNSDVTTVGLGSNSLVDSLIVRWPSGIMDVMRSLPVNQTIHLTEGQSTGTPDLSTQLPATFVLQRNYPNPFNPSTTLRYGLPVRSIVSLKIYSILGREIATLVDEVKPAGYYNIAWNGKNPLGEKMASGIYFYHLEAVAIDGGEVFRDFKKMLLLK